MIDYKKILSLFPKSREERLRAIKRFSMFEVFFYRSSLWHHTLRVFFITNELSLIAKRFLPEYDAEKASMLALVHDDAEIITGDVQLGHKQLMSETELQEVDVREVEAIKSLSQEFRQNIGGYVYGDLLHNVLRKDCIEAQLVSYADKLDAYGESLHEVFGGNISALRAVVNYVTTLENLKKKYPRLISIFDDKDSPFTNLSLRTDPWRVRRENYSYLNKPHTTESVKNKTEFPFYNSWKNLVIKELGKEGVEILTTQTENL